MKRTVCHWMTKHLGAWPFFLRMSGHLAVRKNGYENQWCPICYRGAFFYRSLQSTEEIGKGKLVKKTNKPNKHKKKNWIEKALLCSLVLGGSLDVGENSREKGDGFIMYLSSVLPTSEEFESLIIARPQFGLRFAWWVAQTVDSPARFVVCALHLVSLALFIELIHFSHFCCRPKCVNYFFWCYVVWPSPWHRQV
jgi:hypothetical protein